jgi:citrate synthase
MSSERPWIDAAEASSILQVARTTLYAYVSRGLVRSQSLPGAARERRYSREDVERLRRRTEERRDPGKAAERALQWGIPVLESALTLIDGARLFYRGHDAVGLSRSRSVTEVASLLWTGRFDGAPAGGPVSGHGGVSFDRSLSFVQRAQAALAASPSRDPLAFDLRAGSVALTGWRVLTLLTRAAALTRASAPTIDRLLAHAWRVDRHADVLRAALILCADHELNVSSFTARCVASAGSNPYAVVTAGLSALEGTKHGGASARAESMLDALRRSRPLETAIAERLRRGEPIDGFGHPLYRDGDPRAAALLDLLRERCPKSGELRFVLEVAAAAAAAMRERPNVDFALAAVARVLRLPPGSPLMLFAIGRAIGWIGHAIEQYETGQLIRPRARYVGVVPAAVPEPKIEG